MTKLTTMYAKNVHTNKGVTTVIADDKQFTQIYKRVPPTGKQVTKNGVYNFGCFEYKIEMAPVIEVIFRKNDDGVIEAFFPYEIADNQGNITCYAHIGQHGGACLGYYKETHRAEYHEYKDLLQELQSIYNDTTLRVIQKINYTKYNAVCIK